MTTLTINCDVHFGTTTRGRKVRVDSAPAEDMGRLPRVAKLMALAIRFEGLIRAGVVRDNAELARLGHVTRARITQIMNLLQLAPDIQEQLLFLARIEKGREAIQLRQLQRIAAVSDWKQQRSLWAVWPGNSGADR